MRNTGDAEYPLCERLAVAQIKGESNRRGLAMHKNASAGPMLARRSMRPRVAARVGEVVGIREAAPRALVRLGDLVRDRVSLAIGDRLVLGLEAQAQLLSH